MAKKVIATTKQVVLHKAQAEIAKDTHRFRVVNCGRRFGKTTMSVYEMIGKAVSKADRKIAYIAPNFQQARDIAWQELRRIALPVTADSNEARLELTVKTIDGGTSEIKLRGYEAVDSLRGQFFDLLILDEVATMRNFFAGWEEVLRPTLTDRKGDVMFISTPKGFNHFYELFIKEAEDDDYKSFHYTSYDNPYIPAEEIDKAKEELPEDKFAQEYMADFRKTEGLVYKDFNRNVHIVGEEIRDKEFIDILVGVDFGFSNPASVIKIGKDSDRRYYILEEWYKAKQTNEQILEAAVGMNGNKYYPDPAEPDRVKVLDDAGLYVRDVKKGRDSISYGIDKVRELFKQKRLFVHESCKNVIQEFETYHYPENKHGRNEREVPEKDNDHCFIGGTMVTMADGSERAIEKIKPGDFIRTENSVGEVLLAGKTGNKMDVYELNFSNGKKITGTADHKIYKLGGITTIDTIGYDDKIKVINNLKLSLCQKLLFLTIKHITGMVSIIAQLVGLRTGEIDYTEKFGNITTEKYRKGITFITLTEIKRTILSITLNLKKQENTYRNIIGRYGKTETLEKMELRTLRTSDTLQKSGTNQKREEKNTEKLEGYPGKIKNIIKRIARYVVWNTKPLSQTGQNIATIIAKPKHLGKEDVYNLTVEGEHNYFANGILVSNCMDAIRYVIMMDEPYQETKEEDFNLYSNTYE